LAIKNIDSEGRPKVELLATYKHKTPKGMSVGLYYLPNGDPNNICFLARVCHHRGTNDHVNMLDGQLIDKNTLHVHITSPEYISACFEKYKDTSELLVKLQSADAKPIKNCKCENIFQMEEIAKSLFNISNEMINIKSEDRNLYPAVLNAVASEQRKEK